MPDRAPWAWSRAGVGSGTKNEMRVLVAHLNERLSDLQSYLRQLHDEASFGPLAGAYIVFHMSRSSETAALATGAVDQVVFDFEFRPIFISFVCFGGDLTADIESDGSSILSAGSVSLVGGTGQSFNSRGDFAIDKVTNDLTLHNDSNDSGNPTQLSVTVIGKNVSKVEPA